MTSPTPHTGAEMSERRITPPAAPGSGPAAVPRNRSLLRFAIQSFGITAFLMILVVVFSILSPNFFSSGNSVTILSNVAVIGIVATGQTLVIISGGFDLSVGGTVPLAAVAYAEFSNRGLGVVPALILTVAVGVVVGAINGAIVTRLRINALITTLATLSITGGLAYSITNGQSIPFDSPSSGALANPSVGTIPYHVWLLAAICVVGVVVLRKSVYGRSLYALGGNREASWLAGMRVDLLTASVYIASGALAALGGVVLASQLLAGDGSLGRDSGLTSIAAVVLGGAALTGGVGGILGTLTGVLILGTLADGLTLLLVSSFYQQIVTGVVLLVAVAFSRLRSSLTRT